MHELYSARAAEGSERLGGRWIELLVVKQQVVAQPLQVHP